MAYLTLTDSGVQIFGFDTTQSNNVTMNTTSEGLKTTVSTLRAALNMAESMAKALNIDVDDTTTTSSTASSGSSSTSGSSTVSGATG